MPATTMFKRVRHSPENLLTMVSDVEDYPKFINLLSALRVRTREQTGEHTERFEADASVSYKMISETFRSIVLVDKAAGKIQVSKGDRAGAVKSLKNDWIFHELSDGSTLVEFFVDVRLKAFPLELLIRDKFDKASTHIMNLFQARADQLFEPVGDADLDMDAEYSRLGLKPKKVI